MTELERGPPVNRPGVATDAGHWFLHGGVRGKSVKTTISDKAARCPQDHVNCQLKAPRPNVLWLSNFTYVATGPASSKSPL
ncbi:hypothetical protein ABIA06_006292 [Bradyrhizobium yuanmingense]